MESLILRSMRYMALTRAKAEIESIGEASYSKDGNTRKHDRLTSLAKEFFDTIENEGLID